jgi:hypothetical protein
MKRRASDQRLGRFQRRPKCSPEDPALLLLRSIDRRLSAFATETRRALRAIKSEICALKPPPEEERIPGSFTLEVSNPTPE